MFQGIAQQITKAKKEVIRQNTLNDLLEDLIKAQKTEKREKKKTTTAFSKISFPGHNAENTDQHSGLRDLFFAVFENQENEKDPSRKTYLLTRLRLEKLEDSNNELLHLIGQLEKETDSKRTINSLDRLITRIKEKTYFRYHYQEVSAMLQYILKFAEVEGQVWQIDYIVEIGQTIRNLTRQIIKDLQGAKDWGSWEQLVSATAKKKPLPASTVDEAFAKISRVDVLSHAFFFLSTPFLFNHSLQSHHEKITGYQTVFIQSIIYDWLEGSGTKTTIAKTRQLQGNIDALVHALEETIYKKRTELSLMEQEKELAIEKAERYVLQQRNNRI